MEAKVVSLYEQWKQDWRIDVKNVLYDRKYCRSILNNNNCDPFQNYKSKFYLSGWKYIKHNDNIEYHVYIVTLG